jgi:hypothetical protein
MPGDDWEESIQDALKSAEIVLLLVSPDFVASNYINKNELAQALHRHEQGECGCRVPLSPAQEDHFEGVARRPL